MSDDLLTATRSELAARLAEGTGFTAHPFLPARITPPVVAVLPGSPYLTSGETFGTFRVALDGYLIVSAINNATGTKSLDAAITGAVIAAVNGDWSVDSVSEPFAFDAKTGTQYLAVIVSANKRIEL